ncbi:MAG: T9SS type A sorting domain-containing protein [bacterium]|nr:T9SS type A sorting domain-containing protein [bacterium]
MQVDEYQVEALTVADSTEHDGIHWSVFMMTTHTSTPSVWFASEPDSGYSVDNIAPGVPGGFRVDHDYGNGPSLAWDENGEEDFHVYRIYRGLSEEFEIGPEELIHETAETDWLDTEGGVEHFYKVTALDHAGNESDPASPDAVTGSDASAPRIFALHQNSPNPFNPVTRIRFDLPRAGQVRLDIFDVTGRRITTLVDESREAGQYTSTWRGSDDAGQPVSSGMYFYRLSTDGFNETRKMLLLQ